MPKIKSWKYSISELSGQDRVRKGLLSSWWRRFGGYTFDCDSRAAVRFPDGVGGQGRVRAGVGGAHLVDGDLVAAVGGEVAVDGDTAILLQFGAVLVAGEEQKWQN